MQSVKAAFLADGPQHGSGHNGVCLLAAAAAAAAAVVVVDGDGQASVTVGHGQAGRRGMWKLAGRRRHDSGRHGHGACESDVRCAISARELHVPCSGQAA